VFSSRSRLETAAWFCGSSRADWSPIRWTRRRSSRRNCARSNRARRLAEREAVNDADNIADVFAESVIRPQLTHRLAAGEEEARESFDSLVRAHVLGPSVVHVKLWAPDGSVI